jgi:hypothetical protein
MLKPCECNVPPIEKHWFADSKILAPAKGLHRMMMSAAAPLNC